MNDIPEDLHELEYARQILEEVLAWPAKTNLELIGDCLRSLGKSRRFTPVQAYKYMVRAIRLAKEQAIPVDRFFFMEGKCTEIRPQTETSVGTYQKIDWEAVRKEQVTPEWQTINAKLRAMLAELAGRTVMPS